MERFARWIVRHARLALIGWPVAAMLIYLPAPRIPTLLQDDDTGFVPPSMPSQRGLARLREAFPESSSASRVAVVFVRDQGLTDSDRDYLATITRSLMEKQSSLNWRVRSAGTQPFLAPILESANHDAAVMVIDLTAPFLTHHAVRCVREVRHVLAQIPAPDGLVIEVTGSAAFGELLDRNTKRDVDATTFWALTAVIVILLLVYRSPTAMFLPMIAISVSLMVSLGLVGWAASNGLPINGLVQMFIIVILVGSGVDYCLFLFARFREQLASGADVRRAVELAVARTGPAILAGAGTNIVGLLTLALGQNRDLRTSGPTIAFTMAVAAIVVLTLTPALMRVAGRRLFWPVRVLAPRQSDRSLWGRVGRGVTRHPGLVSVLILMLLVPPSVLSFRVEPLYDSLDEYPSDSSFVRGARLYARHFFGADVMRDETIVLSTDGRFDAISASRPVHRALDRLADLLTDRFALLYQRDWADPLGQRRAKGTTQREAAGADSLTQALSDRVAARFYIGGRGSTMRVDVGLKGPPRSEASMDEIPRLRATALEAFSDADLVHAVGGSRIDVDLVGDTPLYRDLRAMRRRDFAVIATAAILLIFLILVVLIRSTVQAVILIGATLVTYSATYGLTWLFVHGFFGLDGVNWQVDFLLFIIILSLGQDYNIYVVTRIREERERFPLREAVERSVARTGRVVSSCGIIMASAFASMFSGSLIVMKEFAFALSAGIVIDTFLIRPLLVPSLILLVSSRSKKRSGAGPIKKEHLLS